MKSKNFISLVLIISIIVAFGSEFIFAQTVQPEASAIYHVDPGIKGNKIIIELANTSKTTQAQNVIVKLVKSSKQLKFNEEEAAS